MSKNIKRALASVLALSMVLVLFAGCGEKKPEVKTGNYTYNTYSTALGNNWNPHTWETNADDTIQSFLTSPFCTMSILESENEDGDGVYQWIYEMATSIKDVTKDHKDDLTKYKVSLPKDKTAEEVEDGYVYEIALNKDAKWEDGTPITADDYIYSMQQLLNPDMKNYRANLYYSGESAVAGGFEYYYSKDEYLNKSPEDLGYDSLQAAIDDGQTVCLDMHGFWGLAGCVDADGNECPQWVPITDETKYRDVTVAEGEEGDWISAADIWAGYSPYLMSPDYAAYVSLRIKNETQGFSFDGVGLYKVDDYTIRYVNESRIELNYFLTSCTSTWLVYKDLYEAGKDTTGSLVTTDYCTSKETSMSYGPYKLESLEKDKQIVFVQNENWFGWEKEGDYLVSYTNFKVDGKIVQQYQATKIVINQMEAAAAKQAFMKGELTEWSPEADDLVTYNTSDQMYKVDETYTMSLFFHTNLDDLKTMDTSKGNKNSVVLSNDSFRKAMSLSIDRAQYVTATPGYKPAYAIMNNLYFYDIYNDPTSSYRNSDEAMQAICNLYGVEYGEGKAYKTLREAYESINGYNLTEAKELMKQACQELVAANLYKEGEDIVIRIGWKKGAMDSSDNKCVELLNQYVNAAAEGSGFGKIKLEAVDNVTDRYGDVAKGEFAIGYGAWGGAAFYPFRNFQVYCDTDQYDVNEIGCWDPATETLTLKVNGEDVTMTWKDWSGALIGTGRFADADFATKLNITAQMEELYLKKYYRIPLCGTTVCTMLAYQVSYYTDNYNIMYDFGGLRLMKFNYTDEEWAKFVADQGGKLSYE